MYEVFYGFVAILAQFFGLVACGVVTGYFVYALFSDPRCRTCDGEGDGCPDCDDDW